MQLLCGEVLELVKSFWQRGDEVNFTTKSRDVIYG